MQKTKYLLIDSRDRINQFDNTNDFTVRITPAIERFKKVSLKAVSLPITNYIISEDGHNSILRFSTDTDSYLAFIPFGVYDYISIQSAIKSAMEATGYGGIITVTEDPQTLTYTIESDIPILLDFSITENSIAPLIGFEPVDTPLQLSHTATKAYNISIPPYFYIDINNLDSNIRSTNNDYGTFIVYTNVVSGMLNYHFENTHFELTNNHSVAPLQEFNIKLKLRGNRLFDIKGSEFSMLLEFEY